MHAYVFVTMKDTSHKNQIKIQPHKHRHAGQYTVLRKTDP